MKTKNKKKTNDLVSLLTVFQKWRNILLPKNISSQKLTRNKNGFPSSKKCLIKKSNSILEMKGHSCFFCGIWFFHVTAELAFFVANGFELNFKKISSHTKKKISFLDRCVCLFFNYDANSINNYFSKDKRFIFLLRSFFILLSKGVACFPFCGLFSFLFSSTNLISKTKKTKTHDKWERNENKNKWLFDNF